MFFLRYDLHDPILYRRIRSILSLEIQKILLAQIRCTSPFCISFVLFLTLKPNAFPISVKNPKAEFYRHRRYRWRYCAALLRPPPSSIKETRIRSIEVVSINRRMENATPSTKLKSDPRPSFPYRPGYREAITCTTAGREPDSKKRGRQLYLLRRISCPTLPFGATARHLRSLVPVSICAAASQVHPRPARCLRPVELHPRTAAGPQ